MSCAKWHMSYVLCQMSHVTCHLPPVTNAKSYNNIPSPANTPIISSKGRLGLQNLKTVSVTRHETMKIIGLEISRTRTDTHIHTVTQTNKTTLQLLRPIVRVGDNLDNDNSIIFNLRAPVLNSFKK